MHLAVYLPLLVPVAAALSARPLGRHLDPRLATWLLSCSAVMLAAATATVLSLLAVAGLIQIPFIAGLGSLSRQVLRNDDPPSLPVALVAGIALCAAVAAAARMTCRRLRALLAAARQARGLPGSGDVVILKDDTVADAFTIPGRPGRIVVSTGMLTALHENEREALLAHERAHLRSRHHWFIAATQLAAANPLLRPLARTVALAIERWADEDAAEACGNRRLVATTIAKAAIAKSRSARSAAGAPGQATGLALGATGRPGELTDLSGAGPIPHRVAALLTAPPQQRLLLVIGVTLVLAATGMCTLEALRDLHDLLETASV